MAGTWLKLKKSLSAKFSFNSAASSSSASLDNAQSSPASRPSRSPSTANSFSSLLSRTLSLRSSSSKVCAICLGSLKRGQGYAIFVAECSHTFHFNCIADNVKHGNLVCPVCRTKWNYLPFRAPSGCAIDPPTPILGTILGPVSPVNIRRSQQESEYFSNDEVLSIAPIRPASSSQLLAVRSFVEYPAVSASESLSEFGVLLRVCAPPLESVYDHRAPIDLVIVLDISGSMADKLDLVKRALSFIIQNLGPSDRLSIVTFSYASERVLPLLNMSNKGRETALSVINSLTSGGGTNIIAGLKKGVRVLEERRECNAVANIILLSDGNDTHSNGHNPCHNACNKLEYLKPLPGSISSNTMSSDELYQLVIPVHTFGFGEDHDSTTMHGISDASGGTYSFIETIDILQDAFARCIGGLLSVVVQNVTLHMQSVSPGVQVKSIASGKYKGEVFDSGHEGKIDVGNLYAEEEKDFLIYLSVPILAGVDNVGKLETTSLIDVSCFYKDSVSTSMVEVKCKRVEICRPLIVPRTDDTVSLEVDRQKNRLSVTKTIIDAKRMAETGDLVSAQSLLAKEETRLFCSVSAQAGDSLCNWLQEELREIKDRMKSKDSYNRSGRAYVLSGMSSHSWQRASTKGHSTMFIIPSRGGGDRNARINGTTTAYETPMITSMVSKSQTLNLTNGQQSHLLHRSCA